jgi:hypothetical protein
MKRARRNLVLHEKCTRATAATSTKPDIFEHFCVNRSVLVWISSGMTTFVKSVVLATLAMVALATPLHASAKTDDVATSAKEETFAAPPAPSGIAVRFDQAPTIDGKLTEAVWATAPKNGGFLNRFPHANKPAARKTEFAVAYDDAAVYVGVWATDPNPELIRGLLTRRDQESASDVIGVSFDSYHDRRTAFTFMVNLAGVQRDLLVYDDSNGDDSWDAVWTSGATRTDTGWTAEFRIPLSQLRFSAKKEQTWGIQVFRNIARTGEEDVWASWARSDSQIVSRFGTLQGIRDIKPGRRLELLPYLSGGFLKTPVAAEDPLNDSLAPRYGIGLDAKYGLSSAFTLSATINPDFGQVEADPSQVNLTANELFFAERRPFFLEGTELFKVPLGAGDESTESFFYSRRIGATPHGDVDGDYTNVPTATTIFGAAKISGKTESGWSVGVLNALTAKESGEGIDADGNKTSAVVEPLTNFTVARMKKDFREGRSTVGASATSVQRAMSGSPLRDILVDQAYTGGVDGVHRWGDKDAYQGNVAIYGSFVEGSSEAISRLQKRIRHNFQRPDAPHLHYDPTMTSMAGASLGWGLANQNGDPHWRYGLGGDIRTPGLEANDLGYQTGADNATTYAYASYRDESPGGGLLSYRVNFNNYTNNDFEPRELGWGGNVNAHVTTTDMWNMGGGINYNINRWDTAALRGGAALRENASISSWSYFNSDSRNKLQISGGFNAAISPGTSSWSTGGDLNAQIQVRSNIDLSVGTSVSVNEDDRQYIDEVADNNGDSHYLFGRIRQVTAAMTLRMAWTLTTNLGFQLYAAPYLSTGSYSDYKDADQPSARGYQDRFYRYGIADYSFTSDQVNIRRDRSGDNAYSFSRPDFGFRQLNSTLVLRWQYRPGSTIFAIWSHGRTSDDGDGNFRLGTQASRLSRSEGENVVMVKANYWFGL